jgi:hypothetical protein
VKLEGTVVLDGLVEGTLPAGAEGRVRDWVREVGAHGLDFSLEVDGDSFSLLPSGAPVAAARLGHQPSEAVKGALESLLRTFPPAERASVFSTLRSAEVQRGIEVQTVYVVGPTGEVDARQRTVDAETRAAEPAVAVRERLRAAAVALVVLAALVGVASLFFDLRGALSGLWSKVTPIEASKVDVDVSAFEDWIRVTKREGTREGNGVLLTLERTDAFPQDDAALGRLAAAARDEKDPVRRLRRELAVEALARGRIRADLFAENGQVIAGGEYSILALRTKPKHELEVRATRDPRTTRIALVP